MLIGSAELCKGVLFSSWIQFTQSFHKNSNDKKVWVTSNFFSNLNDDYLENLLQLTF